jgi:hypothetical protein
MAQQVSFNVYQINSSDAIPAASVSKIGFPTAGIIVRAQNTRLSSGQVVYGQIQLIATGVQYSVLESQSAIITAANL